MELLTALGCQQGQGFLIGEPVPVLELVGWTRYWNDEGRDRLIGNFEPSARMGS